MRLAFAISLMTALATAPACGKKAETPPPAETAPAETAPAETAAPAATAPAPTPPAGEEQAQPRRGLEEADAAKAQETPPPAEALTPEARRAAALELAPGDAAELGPGAPSATVLGYLPLTTTAVVVLGAPQKLLDAVGFDALTARVGDEYQEAVAQAKEATGLDLLTPSSWAELGVDLTGPAGFAVVESAGSQVNVVFFTIADKDKLNTTIATLAKRAGKETTREQVGGAELITAKEHDGGAIVIRDKTVAVIGSEDGSSPEAVVRAFATQDPASSLARAKAFTGAVKGVGADQDGLVWVNVGYFAAVGRDELGSDGERAIFDRFYGGLHGLAIGLALHDRALIATGSLPLDAGSPLRRIMRNGAAVPMVFGAETRTPFIGLSGNLDLEAVLALVDEGMKTQGQSLASMESALNEMAHIDVRKDVIGALTGEFGFVMDGDLTELMAPGAEPQQLLGGALVIGLRDGAATQKRVEDLMKSMPEAAQALSPGQTPGTWTVPTPLGRALTVRFTASYLVIATDPAFAERVASGDRSQSFVGNLAHPELKALLSREDLAGVFMIQPALGAMFFLGQSSAREQDLRDDVRPGEAKAVAAKRKELAAARAELKALRDKQDAASRKAMMDLFDKVGTTVEAVHVADGGLTFVFGQYLGAPLKDVIVAGVDMWGAKEADQEPLQALEEKVFELESELSSLETKAAPTTP